MAAALQKAQTHDDRVHGARKVKVTILGSEWGPSNEGLSTINRELAIQLAKCPEVEITFFLPKCSQEDKKVALDHKVEIVEATPMPGFEKLDWLCFPPKDLQIDIIVGHGVKLGKQAQVIKDLKTCKWFQVVHTDPEELGMFKNFSNPISEGEEKHKTEVELCKMADHVVGVGPKLSDAFRSYLQGFGLTGLEAMSAGLPVLVSRNSGFGEALRSAAFGSSFVIDSEDPAVWTVAIQNILSKDRECRLDEAVTLRDSYGRKYNWAKQIKELVDKMSSLTHEDSRKARSSFETKCNASQRMESMTEDHEEIDNNQRTNSYHNEQLVSETSLSSDCEMKAEAAPGNPTKISTNIDSPFHNSRKRKMSEFSCNPDMQKHELFLLLLLTSALLYLKGRSTSSEDSRIFFKNYMPSNIAEDEEASFLGKEPLNSWIIQSIPGSTSST
ncbi:unnamed protein product, partial [Porites evermanni]